MKVKLGQIFAANPILGKLVEQQLPIRVAYRLTRLITRLNEEYDALDSQRIKLLEEYGTPVDGVEGQFQLPLRTRLSSKSSSTTFFRRMLTSIGNQLALTILVDKQIYPSRNSVLSGSYSKNSKTYTKRLKSQQKQRRDFGILRCRSHLATTYMYKRRRSHANHI